MVQKGIEGAHPIRDDSSNHITHHTRDFFTARRNYSHETYPFRPRILGAVTISIHFQDEENPIVSIGHSPTNKIFSAAALSLSVGKYHKRPTDLICFAQAYISLTAWGTCSSRHILCVLASETKSVWSWSRRGLEPEKKGCWEILPASDKLAV